MGSSLSEEAMSKLQQARVAITQQCRTTNFKIGSMLEKFQNLPNQDGVTKSIIAMLFICRDSFIPEPYIVKVLTFGKFVYAQYTNKENHLPLIVHSTKGNPINTIYDATRRMRGTPDFTKAIMRVLFLSKFYPNVDEPFFKDLLCVCNYANFMFASTRDWGQGDNLYYIATPMESPTWRTISLTQEQTDRMMNTLPAINRIADLLEQNQFDLSTLADYRMNFRYLVKPNKRYFVTGRFRHAI